MLGPFLLAPLICGQAVEHVSLENGAELRVASTSGIYLGCEDTYLDSTEPNQNFGDSFVLEGGPGKTILIKFGDLDRLGRKKVVKATLHLTPSVEGRPHLGSIRRLLVPWGDGPLRRPFFTEKPLLAATWSATWHDRHAGRDADAWQQGGALGPGDSETIEGATVHDDGKEISISGLEGTVQTMLDRWYANQGFALAFTGPTEFFASKNALGKPRLELDLVNEPPRTGPDLSVTLIEPRGALKDGSSITYAAHVTNIGNETAKGFSAAWMVGGRPGSSFDVPKDLKPGEETTLETTRVFKSDAEDHRTRPLGLVITPKGPDADPSNDCVEIQQDALPVILRAEDKNSEDAAQRLIRRLNDVIFPESRFSFAPEGVLERFRIAGFSPEGVAADTVSILKSAGLNSYSAMQPRIAKLEGSDFIRDSKDRWPGLLGGGFTANDISVPGEIQLPHEPYFNPVFDNFELSPTGLLAASDVAALNANLGGKPGEAKIMKKLPQTVLIRALNMDGVPLPNSELRFYQTASGQLETSAPALKLTTGDNGTVMLPVRSGANGHADQFGGLLPDGSNGVYLVAVTINGVTDARWLKAWQLADSFSRTEKGAAFAELRFNVPIDLVDRSVNLAAGKAITDSESEPATVLDQLVDGTLAKEVALPNMKDSWLEIDLGKDHEVTEIDIEGTPPAFWQRFDILTYYTGQQANDATPYAHEVDWAWNLATRPDLNVDGPGTISIPYRGSGKSVRYIRFVCRQPGAQASVAEIRVLGAKIGTKT